jgi:hypothetical protein
MMHSRQLLFLLIAATPLLSGVSEQDLALGAELLQPFKQQLQSALRDGLARGPAEAIAACQTRAPEIAAALSEAGIRVGRASQRLRNPANAPPEWAEPLLDAYRGDPSVRAGRAVALDEDRRGYVEPIFVQALCLTCHGENLSESISSRLSQLYPEDRAVGYRVGDLRGVFWVEFPTPD